MDSAYEHILKEKKDLELVSPITNVNSRTCNKISTDQVLKQINN